MTSTPPSAGQECFVRGCRELGIDLDDATLDSLSAYLDAMLEANRSVNLTAVRDAALAWERHLLDSAAIAPIADACAPPTPRVLDVGSGAGLPGIPLAILRPEWDVTLLESVAKKAECLRRLAPAGVRILQDRAETAARVPEHRETYDLVTARAVASLDELVELTLPFVRPGGHVLAMKGAGAEAELAGALAAIQRLGGAGASSGENAPRVLPSLPGMHQDAVVVRIAKVSPTPPEYPRRPGIPKKRPLR